MQATLQSVPKQAVLPRERDQEGVQLVIEDAAGEMLDADQGKTEAMYASSQHRKLLRVQVHG